MWNTPKKEPMNRLSFFIVCAIFFTCTGKTFAGDDGSAIKEENTNNAVVWRAEFKYEPKDGKNETKLPDSWEVKTKPGTAAAKFTVVYDKIENKSFAHMTADKASASIICEPKKIDPQKTPIIRWRWKVNDLPAGGDGKNPDKDDQAIGIYIGTGSIFNKKSVSYRWDTETAKNSEGNCSYGLGTIGIKWWTLRNKEDTDGTGKSKWFVEERNFAEDFNKAWGEYPKSIYISVSCNSQYTGTTASADLEWIEIRQLEKTADIKKTLE